ncbi:MAG: hypothetical protein ACRECW_09135 [Phyllobacterium sp.]
MGKLIELHEHTPRGTPVTDILMRIGRELESVANTLGETHPLASSLDWATAARDIHFLQAVQQLDRLEQTVRGLEQFLTALTAHVPADLHADMRSALEQITLSALASRLNGDAPVNETEPAENNGDCDFF